MMARLFWLFLVLSLAAVWASGSYLSKPVNQVVAMPAGFEAVSINGTRGSFLSSGNAEVCALLMHGVRSNRMSMIERATFLREMGVSSLLIDLQAHGETPGEQITFGILESVDARNGVNYLRQAKACKKIIAIGQSLGGASALLGDGPIDVDALVLESVYPTIEEAVEDRLEMRLGALGRMAAPLLYWQIPLRIDASLSELRPIDAISRVKVPVFIIGGMNDEHTKAGETRRLYARANEDRQLWLVEGAAHEDMYSFSPDQYRLKISSFIKRYLSTAAG